jgi:hypothetical protein
MSCQCSRIMRVPSIGRRRCNASDIQMRRVIYLQVRARVTRSPDGRVPLELEGRRSLGYLEKVLVASDTLRTVVNSA